MASSRIAGIGRNAGYAAALNLAAVMAALGQVEHCFQAGTSDSEIQAALGSDPFPDGVPERCDTSTANFLGILFGDQCVWYHPGDGHPLRLAALADPATRSRASLTFSFFKNIGTTSNFGITTPLTDVFGDLDLGKEYCRQAMARYIRWSGIDFAEVADSGGPVSSSPNRPSDAGDLRMGMITGSAGQGAFPYSGGEFFAPEMGTTSALQPLFTRGDFRALRSFTMHEMGHGLSFYHFLPLTRAQVMEPFFSPDVEGLSQNERRAVCRNYDDRFFPNYWPSSAHDFGLLDDRSVREFDLALNRVADSCHTREQHTGNPDTYSGHCVIVHSSGDPAADWFRFTIPAHTEVWPPVRVEVDPTGGTYWWAPYVYNPTSGLADPAPLRKCNASAAGKINIIAYEGDPTGVTNPTTFNAGSTAPGHTAVCLIPDNNDGNQHTYYVLVDEDDAVEATGVVQLYNLHIEVSDTVGPFLSPPRAVAGINKLVKVSTSSNHYPAHFMGDMLSHATEPGTTLISYEWDFTDGSGFTASVTTPRACHEFTAAGTYTVKLRVTDSFGSKSIDTITVTAAN